MPRFIPQLQTPVFTRRGRPKAIGIVVAMESRIGREGLVALLRTQRDFRVLGAAGTSGGTLSLCIESRPDVLILGTLLPWPREVSGISAILLSAPDTRVLAMAPHGADRCALLNPHDPDDRQGRLGEVRSTCLQLALSRGALGAVNHDVSLENLFAAIRSVAAGKRWVAPGITAMNGDGNLLSSRECDVARLIGQGSSNKEISRSLGITEMTVKKHVANILHKLGLHDRLQLGLCVARHPLPFAGAARLPKRGEAPRRR